MDTATITRPGSAQPSTAQPAGPRRSHRRTQVRARPLDLHRPALALLPIFYSHLALNDVPTLAPVALSLYGTSGVMRRGRLRDYAIAGLGVGLAAATKYTGGITLLCLGAAFVSDSMGGAFWVASRRFALALALALIAFVLANPYSLLDPASFLNGVGEQASLAAGQDPVKLGTRPGSGTGY